MQEGRVESVSRAERHYVLVTEVRSPRCDDSAHRCIVVLTACSSSTRNPTPGGAPSCCSAKPSASDTRAAPSYANWAGLCALNCVETGDGTSSTAPADSGLPSPDRDRGMKGRCPIHQGYMAGWRPVAYPSLRWLHASCAVASAALRPAGRAARAGYRRVLNAAHEQNRRHAGPALMRVRSAAAKYRVWRRTLADCSASREWRQRGGVPARACSRLAARVNGGAATRHRGAVCRVGLSGCCAVARAACGRSRARDLPSGLCWSACCAGRVRGCPYYLAVGSPRAWKYSGQRRCDQPFPMLFVQVRGAWRCRWERYGKTAPFALPASWSVGRIPFPSWPGRRTGMADMGAARAACTRRFSSADSAGRMRWQSWPTGQSVIECATGLRCPSWRR